MRPPKFLYRWERRLELRCPGHHGAPPVAWHALALVRFAIRTWVVLFAVAMLGCAPSLRGVDVDALRDVQADIAVRQLAAKPGGDRLLLKTEYCELEAVLAAAGKPHPDPQPIRCTP